jgi:hypothetical protein
VYLEIGVQYGTSLVLAEKSRLAVGLDPQPLLAFTQNMRPNQEVYAMTSDQWFGHGVVFHPPFNLGFIDGLHLFEQALKDFMNMEQRMAPDGVIIVDDVLPYSQAIAEREQPPGDWTGDVWKLYPILRQYRPDLKIVLVDTAPTGTMVITNLDPTLQWPDRYDAAVAKWWSSDQVPDTVLERTWAVPPEQALEDLCALQ